VHLLWSAAGRGLGAVSNGGRLPDGTVSQIIKRTRLYWTLHQQAAGRGLRGEVDGAAAGAAGRARLLRLAGT
jgi:hypothetical protein